MTLKEMAGCLERDEVEMAQMLMRKYPCLADDNYYLAVAAVRQHRINLLIAKINAPVDFFEQEIMDRLNG
jgi:hypothetical protein